MSLFLKLNQCFSEQWCSILHYTWSCRHRNIWAINSINIWTQCLSERGDVFRSAVRERHFCSLQIFAMLKGELMLNLFTLLITKIEAEITGCPHIVHVVMRLGQDKMILLDGEQNYDVSKFMYFTRLLLLWPLK